MENKPGKQKVLIVDDTPENIHVLMETLKDDYTIVAAINGEKALALASTDPIPDIVLLDIMMPEMDGYEVCRRLKADALTKNIPVIFVTAKGEVSDETMGFEVGAVDYITKPISPPVVQARVKTHLELKNAREELEKQNEVLRENARLREDVEHITRHDLKTPLNGIINFPSAIQMDGNLSEKQQRYLDNIVQLGRKLLNLINLSLDLYKMEKGIYQFRPSSVNVLSILGEIIDENSALIEKGDLAIKILMNGAPPSETDVFIVSGERLLFYSMLANITKNAIEASPTEEQITILLETGDRGNIRIHNKGVVPVAIRDRFFEKYTTSGKKQGTGLGTYSARLIAETQKGTVDLETSEAHGTTIAFSFPIADIASSAVKEVIEGSDAALDAISQTTESGKAWSPRELTPEQLAQIPELCKLLESQKGNWETLSATLSINEMEDFANGMKELGEEYGYQPLVDWGENLALQVSMSELESMSKTLGEFPGILKKVESITEGQQ